MAQCINTTTVSVTTSGTAGAATGSGTSIPINGELLDIYLDYEATAPATTDVTISESTFGTIMVRSDSATDGRFAPRMVTHGPTASALTWYDRYPLKDSVITVSLAQCNAITNAIVVTIRWVTYF